MNPNMEVFFNTKIIMYIKSTELHLRDKKRHYINIQHYNILSQH